MMSENSKILFAEDDNEARQQYVSFLRKLGYNVVEARNAEETLNILRNSAREYRLLVLDIIMPKNAQNPEQSNQASAIAKTLEQESIQIKIKFITDYPDRANTHELETFQNFEAFHAKPLKPKRFLENVQRCMGY